MMTLLLKEWLAARDSLILPVQKQIKIWQRANRKMTWGISRAEFEKVGQPPQLTQKDREDGFIGAILSYGFGDDGCGNSDSVFSAKIAWEYARKRIWGETWQCEYIDFKRIDDIRLRPDAPARSSGFYFTKFQPGERYLSLTVNQVRKNLRREDTGCGPEGVQFLAITHPHFQTMMNERKIPFMALADLEVAPHGFNDFFDAPQLFCSNDTLGLGIGNIDNNYPLFGIPTLRFQW